MNLKNYISDHLIYIIAYIISNILIIILLNIFNINKIAKLLIITLIIIQIIPLIVKYIKESLFYKKLDKTLEKLDQKYLITEIIKKPNFLEGQLLCDYLYIIDKSMIENINKYKLKSEDFTEYLEAWCHEIKTPIQTTNLIIENNKNKITKSIEEELKKQENYIDQIMYYVRSNNVEKDYIIKKTDLRKVIDNVITKNKKALINKKIKIDIKVKDYVYSDSKWLEFIINQIIINSIKYTKENPEIKIKQIKTKENIVLSIKDNGIGIKKEEQNKVFNKGFTGTNGRKEKNSTGIGLYLVKKLTEKLGHNINLISKENIGTEVQIIFPINSLTNNLTKS